MGRYLLSASWWAGILHLLSNRTSSDIECRLFMCPPCDNPATRAHVRLWHRTVDFCGAAIASAVGGFADFALSARWGLVTHTSASFNSLQWLPILWVHDPRS